MKRDRPNLSLGFAVSFIDTIVIHVLVYTNYRLILNFTNLAIFAILILKHTLRDDRKYGFYQSEENIFHEIATNLGLKKLSEKQNIWCRHPLAFLVEAADDICYRLIDLEDGYRINLVSFNLVEEYLLELVQENYDKTFYKGLGKKDKIGYLRGKAIFKLIFEIVDVYKEHYNDIMKGKFCGELLEFTPSYDVLSKIKKEIIKPFIYKHKPVIEL